MDFNVYFALLLIWVFILIVIRHLALLFDNNNLMYGLLQYQRHVQQLVVAIGMNDSDG